MKKVTKAIKAFSSLNEEEKAELAEFFKKEEEETVEEVKEEVEVKKEIKVEPVVEKIEEKVEKVDFEKMFKQLTNDFKVVVEEVKTLKEQKVQQVGIKAKPKAPSSDTSFDNIFNKLTQGQ